MTERRMVRALDMVPGHVYEFVRYHMVGDEWTHSLVRGRYVARTDTFWSLVVDGVLWRLPRDVWEVCEQ
jgi:hypothetical protein